MGNVAGISFLLALVSSSVLLRKLTQPLNALTSGTRAVLRGDFSRQVDIAGPRSEFTDLADSFNAMTKEVGRDLQLFQLLAQIDRAIVDQCPFEEVVQLFRVVAPAISDIALTALTPTNYPVAQGSIYASYR